jgi:hypothetical protein
LAEDVLAATHYHAARAAASAGCGQGKDAVQLDDKERAVLRRQALDWLLQDLTWCGQWLDDGVAQEPTLPLRQETAAALRADVVGSPGK